MLLFVLTIVIIAIPTIHLINEKSVQKIALFIGASHVALMALNGKIDVQLSDFIMQLYNKTVAIFGSLLMEKIVCLFAN
ncbi:MAG TPA: hypothetical protein PLT17_01010 [Chitinophagales bacterium]|nr:hypothetical protein [Chitinophagales bacterium]